jgi:predicted DNA-binding WGR domain protein
MLRLECRSGGHNKYYEFDITITNGNYTADGYYGRIGNGPQISHLYSGANLADAHRAVTAKVNEKLQKGYIEVGN